MEYNGDLHLHTIESKISGEVFSWKNLPTSLKILKRSNIDVFSFSDHDSFNVSFYKQAQQINKQYNLGFIIIPAVEVTVINSIGDKGHIIFYFEENLKTETLNLIKTLIQQNCNREGIQITKMIKVFNNYKINFALIVHVGKVNYVTLNDIEQILPYVYSFEGSLKHSNMKKVMKVYPNIKTCLFSDTHVWEKYKNPLQKLNVTQFLEFIKSVKE